MLTIFKYVLNCKQSQNFSKQMIPGVGDEDGNGDGGSEGEDKSEG